MATIVDALVVTLGLDATGFKKGKAEADAGVKETAGIVTKSAADMASALSRVALKFVELFIVIRSIHDVIDYFEDINAATRQLGYDSKNLGIAAGELRDWQNAAELAGGSAENVTRTIASFQQSLFNLQFNGKVSDQLLYLMRLGVQFQTTTGQMRPFRDILMSTAAALERNGRDRATNFQFLQAAGFDAGSINLILGGTKALDAAYQKQLQLQQINDRNTAAAQRLAESWIFLKQSFTAAATQILTELTPYLQQLFETLQQEFPAKLKEFADWVKGGGAASIGSFFKDLNTVVHAFAVTLDYLGTTLDKTFGPTSTMQTVYLPVMRALGLIGPVAASVSATAPEATRGIRNNNPLNLKATGTQARDAAGFAIFGSVGEGISAAYSQLQRYAGRGINTIRGIVSTWAPAKDGNNVAAYIAQVSRALGKPPDLPLTAEDYPALMNAMARLESGSGAPRISAGSLFAPNAAALGAAKGVGAASAVAAPAAQPQGAPIASSATSNNVQIDSITVNTQATDANRIAADLERAMQRKFVMAQVESGLV